jgi:predicted RND superfamily exporter protein
VSVIILVMAVGLSVDYSVHVMHAFLTVPGESRSARAYEVRLKLGLVRCS